MKSIHLIFGVGLLALGSVFATAAPPTTSGVFRGKVRDLAPAPAVLGKDWVTVAGLVVEDFDDLQSQPAASRPIAAGLKDQLRPLGVSKAADFSFRLPDQPARFVTLRVFVFDTSELCSQWWAKKYRHDGWEKFYQPVAGNAYEAVDSKDAPKRAAAVGNVWMTCHAIKDHGDHIAIMDACIEKVLEAMKAT
jgi:hypothetical protein